MTSRYFLNAKALERPTRQRNHFRIGGRTVTAQQFHARHRKLAKAAALRLFIPKDRSAVRIAQRERQVLIVAQVVADDGGGEFRTQREAPSAEILERIHLRDDLGAGLAQVEVGLLHERHFYRAIARKLKGVEQELPHLGLRVGLLGVEVQHPTHGVYGTGF